MDFVTEACNVGVCCDLDSDSDGDESDSDDEGPATGGKRKAQSGPQSSSKKSKKAAASTTPGARSPKKTKQQKQQEQLEHSSHTLAPISTAWGWKGRKQQACGVCSKECGFYCVECSADKLPGAICPVHPLTVRGKSYTCSKVHAHDPSATKLRTSRPQNAGSKKKRK